MSGSPSQSYVRRKIEVAIKLGKGDFGTAGFDTVTLKGLRVSASIQKAGSPGFDTAQIRIYGMTLDLMNRLTTLGKPMIFERDNSISISAGDDRAGMALVFFGIIQEAWTEFDGAPEVFFTLFAQTGALDAAKPVPPSSYGGAADVVVIMSNLATLMGRKLENSGVSGIVLSNPYFPGTATAQIEACARAANIGYSLENQETLAIWPMNGSRGGAIPLISPGSGMIGYPSYTGHGIRLRSLYNPSILFNGQVQVESSVTPANGKWIINALTHILESETPSGAWFSEMEGYRFGDSPTVSR